MQKDNDCATKRSPQRIRTALPVAALTAFLLSTTALPALAAVTEGVALSIAPGAPPETTTRAPAPGERIQAPADRTVEYVLPDGTTLTLAPGASLTLTEYEYDPDTRTGELALKLGRGLFRIAGGAINNQSPITIEAGEGGQACKMTLANGTAVVAVGMTGATRAYLLLGERLTMTSGDASASLVRPGFQLTSNCQGDEPEEEPLSEAQLRADLFQLNPGLLFAVAPEAGDEDEDGRDEDDEDEVAQDDEDEVAQDDEDEVAQDDEDEVARDGEDEVAQDDEDEVAQDDQDEVAQDDQDEVAQDDQDEVAQDDQDDGVTPGDGDGDGDINGDDDGVAPGDGDGDDTVTAPGDDTITAPDDDTVTAPDDDTITAPDDDTVTAPGDDTITAPDDDTITAPGDDVVTPPDDNGDVVTPGPVEPTPVTPTPVTPTLPGRVAGLGSALDTGQDLGPGRSVDPVNTIEDLPSESQGTTRSLAQTRDPRQLVIVPSPFDENDTVLDDSRRNPGLTTNILFNSRERFSSDISAGTGRIPQPIEDENDFSSNLQPSMNLQYIFFGFASTRFAVTSIGDEDNITFVGDGSDGSSIDLDAPIIAPTLLPADGEIDSQFVQGSILGDSIFTHLQAGFALVPSDSIAGTIWEGVDVRDQDVVARRSDNFLLVEVRPAIDGIVDTARNEQFLFAAGDVDGRMDPTFTVDRFFISPGLEGFEQKDETDRFGVIKGVPNGVRAFLRQETAFGPSGRPDLGVPLKDSGVLVVNREFGNRFRVAQIPVLHADFGRDGDGVNERSTLSVTIGEVLYNRAGEGFTFEQTFFDAEGNEITETVTIEPGEDEVRVGAQTFGSSRDNTEGSDGRAPASTFFSSGLFNTSAGGGNPALNTGVDADGDGQLDPRTGRLGYFVLENFDPDQFTSVQNNRTARGVRTGGLEDPLTPKNADDRQGEQQFALLRLGTGQGSVPFAGDDPARQHTPETIGPRTSRQLTGYAAGLGEFQQAKAIGVTPVDAGAPVPVLKPLDPNLSLTTSRELNTVTGSVELTGIAPDNEPIRLGDDRGESAFVDDDTFGVRTKVGDDEGNAGQYAFVTAGILTDKSPTATTRSLANFEQDVPDLEHTQWGFFLGDRLVADGEGGVVREHVHMGAWASGEQLPVDVDLDWQGTATYGGVAVGNVFSDGALSTEIGSYRNQWDFGRAQGDVTMDFDDATYRGTTRLETDAGGNISSPRFAGGLEAPGRIGRHDGTFVGDVESFGGRKQPTGLTGQFSISETEGDVYRATGVVAADRK